MLRTEDLDGVVKCAEDNASCLLDGETSRGGMYVDGTGSGTLILRALSFVNAKASQGGGVKIDSGSIVDIELCVFSNCRSTWVGDNTGFGGGALQISGGTANVYGTTFNGNTADSGNGDDICRNYGGPVTIYDTCPSPYASNTPIQGKSRMRIV
jgi:hypothetical protein